MSTSVIITVPRYVAISPNPLSATTTPTMATSSNCGASSSDESTVCLRGKKRRLDHLSWEEKLQRKKLKNRVAAQTSRDRKKARMEDMEQHITELTEKTEILQNKCDSLQAINESLLEKNQKLDKKVECLKQQLELLQSAQQRHQHQSENCVDFDSILKGSAVSTFNPLPQGMMESQSITQNNQQQCRSKYHTPLSGSSAAALWQTVALCLLYKTCSKISTPLSWKSLPKVYSQISLQTWKEAIQKAIQMLPKMQASQSDCLDQWWGPHQKSWNPANIQAATIST